jgi:RNA polymerase sigma-70 factor (ECF subfamily)
MPHAAEPTDEELLDAARRGDSRAFRLLVERYEGKVAAVVVSMLGPGPDADDIGQETFIRLYKSIDQFRGDARLGTYITRIAINQSLKALKRRKKWRERFFTRDSDRTTADDALVDESAVDSGDAVFEDERRDMVQRALRRLNPEHRSVVILRILEGYSTRETADLLAIPEGTVMSRLSRALSKLEAWLDPTM